MKTLLRALLVMAILAPCTLQTNQLHAQVIYSFTGLATPDINSTQTAVEILETFVADFVIDDSVFDSDPTGDGFYEGAILSSSIEFSGGFVSAVDFTGGDITIQLFEQPADPDDPTSPLVPVSRQLALTPSSALGNNSGFLVTADPDLLDSDVLFTEPGSPLGGLESTAFLLLEPPAPGADEGTSFFNSNTQGAFNVLSVPEPSTACFLGAGILSMVVRRRRK